MFRRSIPFLLILAWVMPSIALAKGKGGSSGGTVHVREYTRKDGTVVHAHDRAAPGTASVKSAPLPVFSAPRTEPRTAVRTEPRTAVSSGKLVTDLTDDDNFQTVYITKTGTKYHRAGCQHLSKSSIPISLAKAIASYGPCSQCSPPTAATPQGPVATPSTVKTVPQPTTPRTAFAERPDGLPAPSSDADLQRERDARLKAEQEADRLRAELTRANDEQKAKKAAADQEKAAQSHLKSAMQFLANDKTDAARKWLQEVVDQWPNTKASAEARDLLKKRP